MPVPRRIWTFASGSNNPGEIAGYARAGIPPGVAMLRWSGDAWAWLCGMGTGATRAPYDCWATLLDVVMQIPTLPVFVDTGAFAEAATPKPITPALWHEILGGQLELARRIGPRAALVLPDKVGDQTATLRRLRQYRAQVTAILDARARGIVVLQRGRLSAAQMAVEVAQILGRADFVLGFPTARARTSPGEIRTALAELPWRAAGVHLLGIGPDSDRFAAYVAALAPLPEGAWASCDAVLHRRLVGRAHTSARGDVYPTRPMTEQQDIARAELLEQAWGGVEDPLVREAVDPTEQLVEPSGWMTAEVAREIARRGVAERVLTRADATTFARDPTAGWRAVQQRDEGVAEQWLEQEIERAVGDLSGRMRKERAIRAVFGRGAPTPAPAPEFAQLELDIDGTTKANPEEIPDESNLLFLLGPPGSIPAITGPEQGRVVANGIAHYVSETGSHRYVLYREGVPLAGLQIVDLSMSSGRTPRTLGYIAGVHTIREERRQGHASKLLAAAQRDFTQIEHSQHLTTLGGLWKAAVDLPPRCVGLVSCSKSKLDVAAPAWKLYSPSWVFRKSAEYVSRRCGVWHVLSAKHGVVDPDQVLEPYDVTLVGASKAVRNRWAARVLKQLRDRYAGKTVTFVLMAGERYADALDGIEHADWIRATVEQPMRGMSTGARRKWLGTVT